VCSEMCIRARPSSVTVKAGEGPTFETLSSGYPAPTVQWESSSNGGSSFIPVK